MKQKILFVILTVTLLLAPMYRVSTAQGTTPPTLPEEYQDIANRYRLRLVESIPEGVTPLQFDTPEQLEAYLSQVYRQGETGPHINYFEPSEFPLSTLSPEGVLYTIVTRSCSSNVGLATFNTWADIRVGYTGSFRWIDSVLNTRTGLTGVTFSYTLTNDGSYYYNLTATSVSVKGYGIVNGYLLVQGGILIFSSPVSCSFTYRIY